MGILFGAPLIRKLPPWVKYGAFILALIAGSINAIGLLSFEHQAVSHISGTATLLGSSLVTTELNSLHLVGILVAFFIGACLSGMILHHGQLKLGHYYDLVLILESLLLCLSCYFLSQNSFYGHLAASMACGLQNAMATTYSGAVVRTTHLTGIVTDLGLMLGQAFRGQAFDYKKLILFSFILSGFILGAGFGAFLFQILHSQALLIPAFGCLILAVWYRLYSRAKLHSKAAS